MADIALPSKLLAATTALAFGAAAPALAGKPESVPPSGKTCGGFYGSVVASEARQGHLGREQNPGTLHQGFAGAEAFPFFSCPCGPARRPRRPAAAAWQQAVLLSRRPRTAGAGR